ncbi:MAG: CaiB/BaiF CoA-transferase family protein [Gemmatimonadales bacterium]
MRPLDGITVVSLEHALSAPYCTRQLADLGARVIKVERPGVGDFARSYDTRARGLSSYFVWCNRSKESLTLDLKHPKALAILNQLLDRADVFVQNLAPGAADRLGLGYSTLAARNERLVVCDISGYGSDGPYRDRKAYDLLIQSESGFVSVTGTAEQPVKAGASIADVAAGTNATTSILAALLERERTGRGTRIEIAMLESMVEWMAQPLYYATDGAPSAARSGASHASISPYGPFEAGDGRVVMLGLQNEREWAAFCGRVLERAELAADPRFDRNERRVANRAELDQIIRECFAPLTGDEVVTRLDRAGIANARVNTVADVWAHPQLAARGRWREITTEAGPLPALLPPGLPAEWDPRMDPVPALGEHTDPILASLGLSSEAIAELRSAGAV